MILTVLKAYIYKRDSGALCSLNIAMSKPEVRDVLKNVIQTAQEIQKLCHSSSADININVSYRISRSTPPPPLQLSDPVQIDAELEEIGLPVSTAKSISDIYIRSCDRYRTTIIENYQAICEKGVLTNETQDLLLQILTNQYLGKLETWRKAAIAQVSARICESRRTQSHRFNRVRHKSFIHLRYAAIW